MLNDLDLTVISEDGKTFFPNGLQGPDDKNNVERVRIANPLKGSTYLVRVFGQNLIESQEYSLVITGCLSSRTSDSALAPTDSPTPKPSILTSKPTSGTGITEQSCANSNESFVVEGVGRSM